MVSDQRKCGMWQNKSHKLGDSGMCAACSRQENKDLTNKHGGVCDNLIHILSFNQKTNEFLCIDGLILYNPEKYNA